jgi:hypothetical protein
MKELNPQFLKNLEVLGEIQEDEIVHQDPFEDQPHVHQEQDEHEERDEYKECKKHGMSIDSYLMFASLLE